ncbi:MAG TPA: polyprenyl synthetase family protein [Candidatus Dormibacteraeota bacterium]|nr:polyprenyl synthetase family protein [Candidatus Dormibacteraeota bacterium]
MNESFDAHAGAWSENPVVAAIRHTLSGPGKMVRASILLDACRAVGGDAELLVAAASAIEYGHLASLVHDDLIDGDTVRRNRGTVWHEFGATNAIVAGDLLVFAAFHALAACRSRLPAERIVRALETVTEAGIETCLGEGLELTLAGDVSVSSERYVRMARAKTGSLMRGAAEGGAILGGGTPAQAAALRHYGENLGIAFQLVDDLLPYVTDAGSLGKPVFSDLRNRRATLPLLFALERCSAAERGWLTATFARPDQGGDDVDALHGRVVELLQRTDAIRRTRRLATEHSSAALWSLAALRPNEGVQRLADLALNLAGRDR